MDSIILSDNLPAVFLEKAGDILYQNEAINSLMIGLITNLANAAEPPKLDPTLLRIEKDGKTLTAAIQTPPYNLVVTFAQQSELELIAKHLFEAQVTFPGVVGPSREAELFAIIWSNLTGKSKKLGMGQLLYQLEKVKLPTNTGKMRIALLKDTDLVTQWLVEFCNESLPVEERKSFEVLRPQVVLSIETQQFYLWEVGKGPVAMAKAGRPTLNGITISAVYTPKNHRKNGFASALVAHLSQKMLDSGKKFCVLYTDEANPTSNKIYQEIGYREIAGSRFYLFT